MESIKDIKITNKKIIIRCDFNVTIKDGKIIDDTKIQKSLKTINYLSKDNKIILMSHLGKVKTEEDKIKNTLYPVYLRLKELLSNTIYFSKATSGIELENIIDKLNNNEIVLMENTRYEDLVDKKESGCDTKLSEYWANLADIFVNDAFGSSHRQHTSTYGIKKYLPSYYGFLVEDEITKLNELINNKEKPFTVIMGGAKVEDKLKLIGELLKKCDKLIVTGGIANTFLYAKGINIGKSLISLDNINEIKDLLKKYNEKILTPIDFYVENNNEVVYRNLNNIENEDIIYDLGEESLKIYENELNKSKIIFLNGTVGLYEDPRFNKGTINLLNILKQCGGKVFVGGGDAVSATNKLGFENDFYYKSTGGGATLEYIIDKKLAALED